MTPPGELVAARGGPARVRRVLVAMTGALVLAGTASSMLPPSNAWPAHLLVGGLVLGAAWVSAGLLLPPGPDGRLRSDASLWVAAGLVELAAVAFGAGWAPAALADRVGLLGALTLFPAALVGLPGTWPAVHRLVVLPLLAATGAVVLAFGPRPGFLDFAVMGVALVVIVAVWWRFERGEERRPGPGRDALVWLSLALGVVVLVTIPSGFLLPVVASGVVGMLVLLAPPVAVVLGSRTSAVVEIRPLAARAGGLLLSLLTAFALFAGVLSLLDVVGVRAPGLGLLGLVAVGVAAVFAPVRRLVDTAVERLLFGDRLDPVGAASRFAAELSAADDPVAALRELRSLLNLPYAAVVGDGQTLLSSGRPSLAGEFTLPLTAAGHRVGELRLGLRPGETGPSARDRPVLRIVVPALAQALRSRSLVADVAASRERVVTAVEEDRRRLRRDLHDGLGPTLTGIAYATDAARNVLRSDPELAEELLGGARADTGAAIAEVRHLVDDLRPAVLDQVGLVPALRRQVLSLRDRDGRLIPVHLAADELPPLGAATEVAVFRIVTEALTNVARHARATSVQVRLRASERGLEVEVHDAGGPRAEPWVPGVGLLSMRERVDQLGGTLELGPDGTGGSVRVTLPLAGNA